MADPRETRAVNNEPAGAWGDDKTKCEIRVGKVTIVSSTAEKKKYSAKKKVIPENPGWAGEAREDGMQRKSNNLPDFWNNEHHE